MTWEWNGTNWNKLLAIEVIVLTSRNIIRRKGDLGGFLYGENGTNRGLNFEFANYGLFGIKITPL